MKMVVKFVADVRVIDVQKRRTPSKHYVYVIEVSWSDGSQCIIYRRYSKFFALQTRLIDSFPDEGGVQDPANRILPFLPGKIIFGRSHVLEVALKRKDPIHEYCQALIKLPKAISETELVLTFFLPSDEDLQGDDLDGKTRSPKTADVISDPVVLDQYTALADYKATSKNRVNLIAGDTVEVIEKHENGWWLVSIDDEQGWAPSSYLHPTDGGSEVNNVQHFTSGEEPRYVCMSSFAPSQSDEISLDVGMIVDVKTKHADGWWLVRYKGKEGWAPRANLKKAFAKDSAGERLQRITPPKPKERKRTGVQPPPRRKTVKAKLDSDFRSRSQDRSEAQPPCTNDVGFYTDLVKSDAPPEVEYVALSDYKLSAGGKLASLSEGSTIKVIEKAPNGWWYVKIGSDQEGWVPADIIEKRRKHVFDDGEDQPDYENVQRLIPDPSLLPPNGALLDEFRDRSQSHDSLGATDASEFITIGPYISADETGVSFKEGDIAHVLERNDSGWWFIQIGSEEGWAPSTYLRPHTGPQKITCHLSHSRPSDKIQIFLPPTKPERKVLEADTDYENVGHTNVPSGRAKSPVFPPPSKHLTSQGSERAPRPSPRATPEVPPSNIVDHNKNQIAAKLNQTKVQSQITAALQQRNQKIENGTDKKPVPIPRPKPAPPTKPTNARPARPPAPSKSKVLPKRPPPPNFATQERRQQQAKTKVKKNMFVATATYQDQDEGMLSLKKGQMIEVIDMDAGGWWYAVVGGQSGWVPSNYLKQPEQQS